jgi:hypothetical protein
MDLLPVDFSISTCPSLARRGRSGSRERRLAGGEESTAGPVDPRGTIRDPHEHDSPLIATLAVGRTDRRLAAASGQFVSVITPPTRVVPFRTPGSPASNGATVHW